MRLTVDRSPLVVVSRLEFPLWADCVEKVPEAWRGRRWLKWIAHKTAISPGAGNSISM